MTTQIAHLLMKMLVEKNALGNIKPWIIFKEESWKLEKDNCTKWFSKFFMFFFKPKSSVQVVQH